MTSVAMSAKNATSFRPVSSVTNSSNATRSTARFTSAASSRAVSVEMPVSRSTVASTTVYGVYRSEVSVVPVMSCGGSRTSSRRAWIVAVYIQ